MFFDADKVKGDLVVRRAREGEEILALDTRTYKLNPANVVIADDNGPESIGGIMGGEHSGCDENTDNVLIESALWDPINIAKTGRSHGIITDARYRFERGVDPDYMVPGLERTTELVLAMCGGKAAASRVAGYKGHDRKIVEFPFAEVKRLTGLTVSNDEAVDILTGLGFEVSGAGDRVSVSVPSWRPDIDGKADLVEEVMRIHGVDFIKPEPLAPMASVNGKILTTQQIRTRAAKRALASRGMLEAVTWSFIPETQAKLFGGGKPELKLANPIAADMSDMRPSLLPGLIAAAGRNVARGYGDVALFEVSGTYENDRPEGQRRVAGGIRRGTAGLNGSGRHWDGAGETRRRVRRQGRCAGGAGSLRPAHGQSADRAGRARLVSPGPFRPDQARAQGGAGPFRRVSSLHARRARCHRPARGLRGVHRCDPRSQAQGNPHQAGVVALGLPGAAP